MKPLEDELRNALRHKEAPLGFAERVAGRIGAKGLLRESRSERPALFLRLPKMAWCAVAVVTCLAVFLGVTQYRTYRKTQAEGELAKTQLMLALKIAGQKLSFAQRKILEIHKRTVPGQRSSDQ